MLYNNNWLVSKESPIMWEGFRSSLIASPVEPNEDFEDIKQKRNNMVDVYKAASGYGKRYVIADTAMEVIKRIKVDKLDLTLFRNMFIHPAIYVAIDNKSFYRFVRVQHEDHYDQIFCAKVFSLEKVKDGYNECYFDMFTLDLSKGYIDSYGALYRERTRIPKEEREKIMSEYMDQVSADELLEMEDRAVQILVYLFLSGLSFETVNRGGKKKHPYKFKNDSSGEVVLVDSKWNTIVCRDEAFKVSGHLRLQPCGAGRGERKLVWISEFQKHGYHRRAGKILHEQI